MSPTTASVPEPQSIVIDTAGRKGRGIEELFSPSPTPSFRDIAVTLQSLALRQIDRIEREGEEDDYRCNECMQAWVRGGVERRHLESCSVGHAFELADRLLLTAAPAVSEWVGTHEERAALLATANAFTASAPRIHEVPAEDRERLSANLDAAFNRKHDADGRKVSEIFNAIPKAEPTPHS